jgi:hypothetical protein
MLGTQHATITAFPSLGGSHHGYRSQIARFNGIRYHPDLSNCQVFDENLDRLPRQKGHWLPRASTNVFQTHDLQTWCIRQHHHQWHQQVYQSILRQSSLPPQYQSPTPNRIPPADGWLSWTAEPNNVTVPPSTLELRAWLLSRIVTTGGTCVNQLYSQFHADDTL